jgi:RHS repeat-associated protein
VQGNLIARYTWSDQGLISENRNGLQTYLHSDALATPIAITDTSAAVVDRYRYDAWGHLGQHQGSSQQPFGFTGYQNDQQSGLYYAQQRYYNSTTGRFLSHDPFAGDINTPISLHRYLYANASPAVFVDPTGEVPILSDLANGFDRLSANRIDAATRTASLRNDNPLNNTIIAAGGFSNGVISGASSVLGAVFGIANFGANVAIRNVLPDSTAIAGQVDVELDQGFRTLDTVTTTASSFAQIAVEDPVQAGAIAVSVTASLAEALAPSYTKPLSKATLALPPKPPPSSPKPF